MTPLPDLDGPQSVRPDHDSPVARATLTPAQANATRDFDRARLTVTERVYHQQVGTDPHAVETTFSRWLDSEEERYSRHLKAGEAWQPLDCGWMTVASLCVLKNEEGVFRHVNPTDAQREEAAARIIEVGIAVGDAVVPLALVRPQEDRREEPLDLSRLRVRCRSGVAKFRLTLIPA